MALLLLYAAIFAIIFIIYEFYWKLRRFPPGPLPLPLIGSSYQLISGGKHALETMEEAVTNYGKMYTIWMGGQPMIMVNDYELIKESFLKQGNSFSGRPRSYLFEFFRGGRHGLMFTDGEKWSENRRFSLQQFRDFGFGRPKMEHQILEETERFLAEISAELKLNNGILNPYKCLQNCVGNIVCRLLFGHRFDTGENPTPINLFKLELDKLNEVFQSWRIVFIFFQWSRFLPYMKDLFAQIRKVDAVASKFINEEINVHKNRFCTNSEATDLIDAYFKKMGDENEHFSEQQLKATIFDIWTAGLETTVTTLHWGLLYMIRYPEVQRKIHAELDALGQGEVKMSDKLRLPYTVATVMELQRRINLLPVNLLHSCTENVSLGGYEFEKGTVIIPQIAAVLWDEKIFKNPKNFRPERFLADDGKSVRKIEQFIPFSVGKRSCFGESLAKVELFLIFANFLNRFEVRQVEGEKMPTIEPKNQLNVQPIEFFCSLIPRHH